MTLIENIDLMVATHVVETGKYPKYLIVGGETLHKLQCLMVEMMGDTYIFESVELKMSGHELDTVCGLKVVRVTQDTLGLGL